MMTIIAAIPPSSSAIHWCRAAIGSLRIFQRRCSTGDSNSSNAGHRLNALNKSSTICAASASTALRIRAPRMGRSRDGSCSDTAYSGNPALRRASMVRSTKAGCAVERNGLTPASEKPASCSLSQVKMLESASMPRAPAPRRVYGSTDRADRRFVDAPGSRFTAGEGSFVETFIIFACIPHLGGVVFLGEVFFHSQGNLFPASVAGSSAAEPNVSRFQGVAAVYSTPSKGVDLARFPISGAT